MMKSRAQIAVDYYAKSGYNCSQAVAVTYADLLGLDPMTCFKGMEAFGCGMGGLLGTCGAVSGAVYLCGFVASTGNMDDDKKNKSKQASYAMSKRLTSAFHEKNGTITCHDMKGPAAIHFHSCLDCIADAAILVEEQIFPGQFEASDYYDKKAESQEVAR